MGESACLMQPFSYAAPEVNSLNESGQSISFGRFMSEKLEWEKWSTFSAQNRYVAEAERYSRPGSVAQKKAFFEAHYKKLAAARKAAAEAALLEQENNPEPEPESLSTREDVKEQIKDGVGSKSNLEMGGRDKSEAEQVTGVVDEQADEKENCVKVESEINGVNKSDKDSAAEKQMEKPILKEQSSKASEENSRLMNKNKSRVVKMNSEKTPKSSSRKAYTFTPVKEFNRLASIVRKMDGSRASKLCKDFKTPLRTPNASTSLKNNTISTPLTDNRRVEIAPDSSAKANKTVRARWNFLPTERSKLYSPSCFTPFSLRTEERAATRKKKLEEKFKTTEAQKQQEEKAAATQDSVEKEKSKPRRTLCFKARPLPNFYKQRPKPTDQTKKALLQHQEPLPVETKLRERITRRFLE
ncbi:PREDICTED: protein WVD2-like 7 isoform X2 [Tarenaya hassleriana]|uniref:protein WVD2-like 7 isoform X2 n=1 Tax=Tarenaya hassleriana TaxID=28532 RepID=UPI00053C8559|nr:PREDICTED: protein WVD2-like 7 isoform X2 [Tarenaya hassleriana]